MEEDKKDVTPKEVQAAPKQNPKEKEDELVLVLFVSKLYTDWQSLFVFFFLYFLVCLKMTIKSEEDQQKKEELELLVERTKDADLGVQKFALETLSNEIKTATASMTSVPKPLKFLRPHYEELKDFFATLAGGENKVS